MEVWDDRDRNSTLCDEAAGPVSEEIPAPIATLAPLMLRYTTALGLRPFLVQWVTSLVLSFLSAVIGQLLLQDRSATSLRKALSFAIVMSPPFSHFWYPVLETLAPDSSAVRTLVDQTVWQPIMLCYAMTASGLLNGDRPSTIGQNIRVNGPKTLVSGWTVWPVVQYANQRLVPLMFRNTAMSVFSFAWDIYYSLQVAGGDGTCGGGGTCGGEPI